MREAVLNPLAFFGVIAPGQPGPHRHAALAMRYASARAARDFGKSAAESSDQTCRKQQPICRLVVKQSYIKAFLNTSLITFLKFSLVLTKANLLYPMPTDSALHMLRPFSNIIINKYYHHIGKHFILISILITIFYLIFIKKNNLEVLC